MAATLIKRPSESRLYDMDFTKLLGTGETLNGVTSVVSEPAGLTFGTPTYSGAIAQVRISGGVDGTLYEVEFTVTTSNSNTLKDCGYMLIQDC